MLDCVAWCERQIKKAADAGNFKDWQNYTEMKKLWEGRRPWLK